MKHNLGWKLIFWHFYWVIFRSYFRIFATNEEEGVKAHVKISRALTVVVLGCPKYIGEIWNKFENFKIFLHTFTSKNHKICIEMFNVDQGSLTKNESLQILKNAS